MAVNITHFNVRGNWWIIVFHFEPKNLWPIIFLDPNSSFRKANKLNFPYIGTIKKSCNEFATNYSRVQSFKSKNVRSPSFLWFYTVNLREPMQSLLQCFIPVNFVSGQFSLRMVISALKVSKFINSIKKSCLTGHLLERLPWMHKKDSFKISL